MVFGINHWNEKRGEATIFNDLQTPWNSLDQHLERETRLASSVRSIEIYGVSFFAEAGKDSILDLLLGYFSKKRRNSKASYWVLLIANREYVINPNASIAQVQIEIRLHRHRPRRNDRRLPSAAAPAAGKARCGSVSFQLKRRVRRGGAVGAE